jgi:dTDP-4-amino-4,6-dideoxygalactose transaminase
MISTDFAPNEFADDALASLITLFSPWTWTKGNCISECNKIIHSWFPRADSVHFLSARVGLYFLLKSLDLPINSSVAVTGFTCEAVVLPIQANNLHPLYIDIETDTYSMELNDLNKKLTPQTRVIILQHTFGMVPKYRDKVLQLAKLNNYLVIEDLAHGFEPSFWQKQKLTDNQSLLLSYGRSKALSSVFGGSIISSNSKLMRKLKKIESTLSFPSFIFLFKLLCYKPIAYLIKKTYNILGFGKIIHKIALILRLLTAEISVKERKGKYDSYLEKKYPNALAKLLFHQLQKYEQRVGERSIISSMYSKNYHIPHNSFVTRFPLLIENRNTTLNDVSKKSIYLGNWYNQPVGPGGLDLDKMEYTIGSCPVAEQVCRKIINLPTLVTKHEAELVIESLRGN